MIDVRVAGNGVVVRARGHDHLVEAAACSRAGVRKYFYHAVAFVEVSFILGLEIIVRDTRDPPLRAAARSPDASEFAAVDFNIDKAESLVEIRLVLDLEIVVGKTRGPPLVARPGVPHCCVLAVADAESDQAQALIEVLLIRRFEIIITQTGDPPPCVAALPPRCKIIHSRCHIGSSFLFPRRIDSAIAGLEEAKNLARKSPPPDSDRL